MGWMPSAQLYFRDGDGHSLEFIALLEESPEPAFIGSLSEWKQSETAAKCMSASVSSPCS